MGEDGSVPLTIVATGAIGVNVGNTVAVRIPGAGGWAFGRQMGKPRRCGCGRRPRRVLPDEDKSAHQDAEPEHSTAQTAEQKFIKGGDKLFGIG